MTFDLPHIQVLFQAISSLSIGGGFVFAAYQFINLRKAQRVANFTRLVELQMDLRKMRVHDPALANVYQDDVKDLRSPEEVRRYFFNLIQLSVFEIAWYAHEHGQISDEYFESWNRRMRVIAAEKSFQEMMHNPAMKILHDEFECYVLEMVRNVMVEQGRIPAEVHRY